ncbi:hypothetical protein [Paludibaculum fermentans]|uniref:Uncharacterized protein n=1 Tax=Paludibaculum fermentans TaxID=1473598 RepID=A0A7S7NMN0_PALFE|nr:hypothetical protein [Paludibaculum fermentans]QOY86442.1 hypothetical protein IRI77_27095 [Paludibaculum fermentans]
MLRTCPVGSVAVLASSLLFAILAPSASAGEVSRFRNFQLGSDVSTIVKQTGANPVDVKIVHRRPALVQLLEWRPQSLSSSTQPEPAQDIAFTFYNGELFRIFVNYDRYETEGLTSKDMVDSFSVKFGEALKPTSVAKQAAATYGDQEEYLARWEDSDYRFELIRSSFGPTYKLTGVLKRLEEPARLAALEAAKLDDKEAPQREADQKIKDEATERAKLEKARLVNKPKFKP